MHELARAIVERPGDMDARAVYSDAVAERGDPHGEFVRVSIAAARAPYGSAERRELSRRAAELERRHGARWEAHLAEPFERIGNTDDVVRVDFRYGAGFVDDLAVHRAEAVPAVAAIVADDMPLRALRLRHVDQRRGALIVRRVLEARGLAQLQDLEVHGEITSELCDTLASSLGDRSLTTLKLFAEAPGKHDPDRLAALLSSPACRGLERVELDAGVNDEVALALVRLPRLVHVALDGGRLGKKSVDALAKHAPLRALRLTRCELGIASLCKIASSPHLGRLEWLDVSGKNGLNGAKLPKLLDALALPSLRRLGLARSSLRKEGAEALAKSAARLASVEELDLDENFFRSEGMAALADARLPALRVLSLVDNHLMREGLSRLGQAALLAGVEELDIGRNLWNEVGEVEPFLRNENLRRLRLTGVQTFDHRLEAIAGSMPNLEELEMSSSQSPFDLFARHEMSKLRVLRAQLWEEHRIELGSQPIGSSLELITLSGFGLEPERAAKALLEAPRLERLGRVYTHEPAKLDAGLRLELRTRFGVASDGSLDATRDALRPAGTWTPYRGV